MAKKYSTTGHAQNPSKIQIPSSADFMEELDEMNTALSDKTRHNFRLKRSNVGRGLLQLYLGVAENMDTNKIRDDETFKEAIIEAIKNTPIEDIKNF